MSPGLDHLAGPSQSNDPCIEVALAGFLALAVAIGIGRFALTPVLPMMQEDAGLSVAAGGWLASANYLGYLLGAGSAIWMRIRPKIVIRGSLVAIGLVTIGMGLEVSFTVWIVLRAVAGVLSAWVLIFAAAWCLERLAPLRRPILNGVVFCGIGAGIIAVGGLCIALMHAKVSAATAWIVFGVLALIVSVVAWPLFHEANDSPSPNVPRPSQGAFSWGTEAICLILCYGAFGFGYIIPATFLPVMGRHAIHDPSIFGWCWPVFGTAAVVSTLAAAVSRGVVSNRRLWATSHLVMALGVTLPVVWTGIVGICLAALLVGATFMVATMVAMQEARDFAGHQATAYIAIMTAAFAIGQIAGPISASYVIGISGSFANSLLVAGFLLAMSGYWLFRHPAR